MQTMAWLSLGLPMAISGSRHSGMFRSSRRITITLPDHAFVRLLQRSDDEGRSLSNLAAFLLETALLAAGPGGRFSGKS